MNKVIICGNLGQDLELRKTKSDTSVCNLSVATKYEDNTEWHRVVAFGKTAENCAKYLSKGRQVLVEGRLQTREWEKDGEKRYTTEIVAERVQFIGGAAKANGDGAQASTVDF